MYVTKRKTKIISIRISPEEYDLLKSKYGTGGRRSISAIARDAMQQILSNTAAPEVVGDLGERIRVLDARLHLLQLEVSQLSRSIAKQADAGVEVAAQTGQEVLSQA